MPAHLHLFLHEMKSKTTEVKPNVEKVYSERRFDSRRR